MFKGEGVEKNTEQGLEMIKLTAEMGDMESMIRFARGLGAKAFQYYARLATKGSIQGILEIGGCLERRIGSSPDPAKAAELYQVLLMKTMI
jgi:TPR repeat protein